ncbi:MAG: pyruvate ferredoxin oxidoreductase [Euryarchaeota archaeon]|nr:pyruvate ferredoxin oxidoreductase [Euryarchaeota archaeon]
MRKVITGNSASAYGAKVSRAEVIAAYPITPQTSIVEKIADFVANKEMDAKFIKVESEHSAMAACISASMAGARTYTATSSHGLLLMHEMLIWASGSRAPVVMSNVNRANGPPWSVWADQHDTMAQRDTGWMQFYCESNQEVLDTIIQAYRVGEQRDIMTPSIIIEDAFVLSHTAEPVDIPDIGVVDKFLPPFDPPSKVIPGEPYGYGSLVMPDLYMDFRYKIAESMDLARDRLRQVDRDFQKHFGRSYGGLVEFYECEGADAVILTAGTAASTAKDVVDKMRREGKKVGVARMRVFRPFPYEEVRKLAKMAGAIGVLDRSYCFGYAGPIACEVMGALYNISDRPPIRSYIAGLGGRDITPEVLERLFDEILAFKGKGSGEEVKWVDLKGLEGL